MYFTANKDKRFRQWHACNRGRKRPRVWLGSRDGDGSSATESTASPTRMSMVKDGVHTSLSESVMTALFRWCSLSFTKLQLLAELFRVSTPHCGANSETEPRSLPHRVLHEFHSCPQGGWRRWLLKGTFWQIAQGRHQPQLVVVCVNILHLVRPEKLIFRQSHEHCSSCAAK